jgi:hypothetical protein
MKTKLTFTPIALAIAAFAASPAFASDENGTSSYIDAKADLSLEANANLALNTSNTSVTLKKKVDNSMEVDTEGTINVYGDLQVDSSTMAVVRDSQVSYQNTVSNQESTNSATVSGSVLSNAGNIGVNVTAGDNNQQANAAAISAADASFVFGSTDAEIFAYQHAEHNSTMNMGQTNIAGASDDVAMNAAGNIGMNFSAGSSNQQKNDLAIATGTSRVATATISVAQQNDHNMTSNDPVHREEVQMVPVSLALSASGGYWGGGLGGYSGSTSGSYSGSASGTTTGTSDQIGNVYPDIWSNDPGDGTSPHPTNNPGPVGHMDLDTQTQGGSDLNGDGGALAFNNDGSYSGRESGSYSGGERGTLGFVEAGSQTLAGTVSGMLPVVVVTNLATTNTASLSGNVLASAAGNIGVNVAAGSNNQQYNGLAIAAIHAPSSGGSTGGE